MRLLLLTLMVMMAVVVDVTATTDEVTSYDGSSFADVSHSLEILEDRKRELFQTLSDIATVCQVADANILNLNNLFRTVQLRNQQQDDRIDRFLQQVKGIQHKLDTLFGSEAETSAIADSTKYDLDGQKAILDNAVAAARADAVGEKLLQAMAQRDLLLAYTTTNIGSVGLSSLSPAADLVSTISNRVYDRKCEYGFASLEPGIKDVLFQTNFTVIPKVAVQVVGFQAHLDIYPGYSHDDEFKEKLDVLGMDKYVDYVDTSGFGLALDDKSDGSVQLKHVYCSWSACQYLDDNI